MDLSARTSMALPQARIGTVERAWRQDEPLFASSSRSGPDTPFATLDDAIAGAAFMSRTGKLTDSHRVPAGGAFMVRRSGDAFEAVQLLQPVWKRSFPGNERIVDTRPFSVDAAIARTDGDADLRFDVTRTDVYHSLKFSPATGRVRIDPSAGALAVVGHDWAVVDGALRSVEGRDPFPPPPPPPPPPPLRPSIVQAITLIGDSIRRIETVPVTDKGDAATKQARIGAFELNKQAQQLIEDGFLRTDQDPATISALRTADARLEDAAWQLAKKPSPDGRFNGVDIPGALRDSRSAVEVLQQLADTLPATNAAA